MGSGGGAGDRSLFLFALFFVCLCSLFLILIRLDSSEKCSLGHGLWGFGFEVFNGSGSGVLYWICFLDQARECTAFWIYAFVFRCGLLAGW